MYSTKKDSTISSFKKCCCTECSNAAVSYLEVLKQIKSGYYCSQCASDLKWHGLAKEYPDAYEEFVAKVED